MTYDLVFASFMQASTLWASLTIALIATIALLLFARRVTLPRRTDEAPTKSGPFGCMAGTISFMPGVDLSAPGDERWDAEAGRLFNE